jgi:hypothetical protein
MARDILPPSADGFRLAPVERRHAPLFCFALLTVSGALASFALACATPFAAFAVVATTMLPLRPALLVVLVVTGAWLVNEAIGFGALHYPIDTSTILWGLVIGAAALAATMASAVVLRALAQIATPAVLALALVCAYAAYEFTLLAATPFLGGSGAFTVDIVARLGLLSACWLIALVAVCEIVRLFNPLRRGHAVS